MNRDLLLRHGERKGERAIKMAKEADPNELLTLSSILKEVKEAGGEALARIRQRRNYRIPKGFTKWDDVLTIVFLALITDPKKLVGDSASMLFNYRLILWLVNDAPVYLVDTKLLRAFEDMQPLASLFDNIDIIPIFILMFPVNSLRTPSGASLDWVVVHYCNVAADPLKHIDTEFKTDLVLPVIAQEVPIQLNFAGIASNQCSWYSAIGIENGEFHGGPGTLGRSPISAEDARFLDRLKVVVINAVLTLAYRPELLGEVDTAFRESRPHQKTHERRGGDGPRLPRWLGKGYQPPRDKPGHKGGTHASPRMHWRVGHSRRVKVGRGKKSEKLVQIAATLVNAKAE